MSFSRSDGGRGVNETRPINCFRMHTVIGLSLRSPRKFKGQRSFDVIDLTSKDLWCQVNDPKMTTVFTDKAPSNSTQHFLKTSRCSLLLAEHVSMDGFWMPTDDFYRSKIEVLFWVIWGRWPLLTRWYDCFILTNISVQWISDSEKSSQFSLDSIKLENKYEVTKGKGLISSQVTFVDLRRTNICV